MTIGFTGLGNGAFGSHPFGTGLTDDDYVPDTLSAATVDERPRVLLVPPQRRVVSIPPSNRRFLWP